MSELDLKSASGMKWSYHAPIVIRYLKGEQDKYIPKAVQRFGENFKLSGETLFLFDREIVIDKKRKLEILDKEEGRYGGIMKAMHRVKEKFIGISRKELSNYFGGSERRQLKARYQKQKANETYIHARTPGTLQIDLTFYKGQKYPVFGAVDVFSRWCFYERVTDKQTISVVKSLEKCHKEFERVSKYHKLNKVSFDSGVEFRKDTDAYLRKHNITIDRQVKSRKMIEALNRALRNYNERKGWSTTRDLDENIDQFVSDYNVSRHSSTRRKPIDLVSLKKTFIQNLLNKADGKSRVGKGKGFNMATLIVGDSVRVYDPRRYEVKAKQKAKLKGKIKLNEGDYVKQYTSRHRGQAPHWSLKIYTVEKIIEGEKRTLYRLKDRKGVFVRSELQKVRQVLKKAPQKKPAAKAKPLSPRKKKPAVVVQGYVLNDKQQAHHDKVSKMRKKDIIVDDDLLGRQLIVFYEGEDKPRTDDPGTVIAVHDTFPIMWHDGGELQWCWDWEVVTITDTVYSDAEIKTWAEDQKEFIKIAKGQIEDSLQGK